MEKRTIIIAGNSEDEARVLGARNLGLKPDEVSVESTGESDFTVTEKDLPARVDIFVSADKMSAMIQSITPPRGNGPALTKDDVLKTLSENKVVFGINSAAIDKVVADMAKTGKVISNQLVAKGTPAEDGKDAQAVFLKGCSKD